MTEMLRQRILEAAADCFARQGYAGTTVNEVCRVAGVAPATLYRYFRNKKALFELAGIPTAGTPDRRRRQEILEAALELFSRHGYHGATMTAIAAHAGVARATLYAQFPTKDSLLNTLLEEDPLVELLDQFTERSAERLQAGAVIDPARDLEYMACQYLQTFQDARRVALLRLILAEATRHPRLERLYHRLVNAAVGIVGRYLYNLFPHLADPHVAARLFIGSLLIFVLTHQLVPGSTLRAYSPEDIARQATAQLLSGIARPSW